MNGVKIKPSGGRLGILLPGLGAVSTTFIAGVELLKKNLSLPYGSLTQMQTIRLGRRDENRTPLIKDFVPLADIQDLEFAAWDLFEDNAYEAAKKAGVLHERHLESVREEMEKIKPMKAVFDQDYVKNLNGSYIKHETTKYDLTQRLRAEIKQFKEEKRAD